MPAQALAEETGIRAFFFLDKGGKGHIVVEYGQFLSLFPRRIKLKYRCRNLSAMSGPGQCRRSFASVRSREVIVGMRGATLNEAIEQGRAAEARAASNMLSLYYLELESLLDRIQQAVTHYQVLGLSCAATNEEIRMAYRRAVAVLLPPSEMIRNAMPESVAKRAQAAFRQVSGSFQTLINYGRRIDYDNRLRRGTAPGVAVVTPSTGPLILPDEVQRTGPLAVQVPDLHEHPARTVESAPAQVQANRRRARRVNLSLPIRISGIGYDNEPWQEVSVTVDISRFGAAVRLRRRLSAGDILQIELPLPDRLRSLDQREPVYKVYSIVRHSQVMGDGFQKAGIEFLGSLPGISSPDMDIPENKWDGTCRRQEPRYERCEVVGVEYLRGDMQPLRQEVALTENLSCGGARVHIKSAPASFDLIRITNLARTFNSLAAVRNRFTGSDGFERLCLCFLDGKYPL